MTFLPRNPPVMGVRTPVCTVSQVNTLLHTASTLEHTLLLRRLFQLTSQTRHYYFIAVSTKNPSSFFMGPILEAIVAAVSFIFIALIFSVIVAVCRGEGKGRTQARTRDVHSLELSSIEISESATFDPSLNRISMPELVKATQNFSTDLIIGDGGFGLVYKARLANGVTVALKKLGVDAFQGFREFRAEMETLGKLRHPNIVTILGYCSTGSDRVLILEFIERGSLDQWLLDTSSSSSGTGVSGTEVACPPLTWETRLNIINGVANGLSYMHNLETPIIHRDIKASNVLLDLEFEAHIADFGLARRIEGSHSHVSTQAAGTMGYMPPEYINGATAATTMGDVYSFGILMLEIATGIRANLPFKAEDDGEVVRLDEWARKMVEQNRQMEMLDSNIPREEMKESDVVEFFRIATLCTSHACRYRPTMKEVVGLLGRILT